MHRLIFLFAFFSVPYNQVQATASATSSPVSRFSTVHIHLRNLGDMATGCTVKAGGQKRITGLSAYGEADVTFDAVANYSSFTLECQVN